jgi:CheY-like chemotaxis protein
MKKSLLLVDDDYLDVESVKRALKKLNTEFDLHVAHNGADALALITSHLQGREKLSPDIILLDINMPKMNGMEFLRIVKNYYSLKQIKIYILTTSAEEYDKITAENLGVNGYIVKPLDFKNVDSFGTAKLLEDIRSQ